MRCLLPGGISPQLLPSPGPVETALSLQAAVAKARVGLCRVSPPLGGGKPVIFVSGRKQLACLRLSCVCR